MSFPDLVDLKRLVTRRMEMPKIEVNEINIAYKIAGEGPPLVFTPGGRAPRGPYSYAFAGRAVCKL